MQVTFWGVRGSIATSGPEVARFGGNTACVEVEAEGQRLILDAGTGIRPLGQRIMAESRETERPVAATLLFTHLHWDHIQGFPFFAPAFVPGAELRLYGPVGSDGAELLEEALARQMRPPSFPVPLSAMGSAMRFSSLAGETDLEIGPFGISTRTLDHPQGCLGYRIVAGGKSLCFATDVELEDGGEAEEKLADFARDVDLLVCDAQYTPDEYEGRSGMSRRGWGHSTFVSATRAARLAGVARLALFHHDPSHDDSFVQAMERESRSCFRRTFAAREGLIVLL